MKSSLSPRPVNNPSPDVFALAKERYTIFELWKIFGLDGSPGTSCKSPFREDKNPSFSVFEDGRKWRDHATGEGGDVVEFVKSALGGEHSDAREWLSERLCVESRKNGGSPAKPCASNAASVSRVIQWPSELSNWK